jgi:hypothetical protein
MQAGACVAPRASESPAWECETYQAAKPERIRPSTSSKRQDRFRHENEPRGLCSDCELRRDCAFSKPEGGVWHCELYR